VNNISHLKTIFLAASLAATFLVCAQEEKKDVEIINADYLKMLEVNGKKYTRLIGNVQLKQEEIYMWCDSANLDKETNSVDAYGNVRIQQDTVNAFAQTLHYDGNKKFGILSGNARLSDTRATLYTPELFYDVRNKLSYYLNRGRIVKDSTVITSGKGYYYNSTSDVYFKLDVIIKDPDYDLNADSLIYNTQTKISTFTGPTIITNPQSRITCSVGWFNSEQDKAIFGKGTIIENSPQKLFADSLYYERKNGYGKLYDRFQWIDSSMGTELFGYAGEYHEKQRKFTATKFPLLIYKLDKDSLFLNADTLKSSTISEEDTTRIFYAYHHVKMFTKQMQGVCDSLFYSFKDSTFRFYYKPVLWSDNIQMSGDTITLSIKNKQPEKLSILQSGFIVSPSSKKYFDQIKGTNVYGYFDSSELRKMDVEGNAESLYFGKNDKGKLIGNNKALSSTITMHFKDKKLNSIVFRKKPEAVFTPMKMLTEEQMQLKDFNWQIDRKPASREELIQHP